MLADSDPEMISKVYKKIVLSWNGLFFGGHSILSFILKVLFFTSSIFNGWEYEKEISQYNVYKMHEMK